MKSFQTRAQLLMVVVGATLTYAALPAQLMGAVIPIVVGYDPIPGPPENIPGQTCLQGPNCIPAVCTRFNQEFDGIEAKSFEQKVVIAVGGCAIPPIVNPTTVCIKPPNIRCAIVTIFSDANCQDVIKVVNFYQSNRCNASLVR